MYTQTESSAAIPKFSYSLPLWLDQLGKWYFKLCRPAHGIAVCLACRLAGWLWPISGSYYSCCCCCCCCCWCWWCVVVIAAASAVTSYLLLLLLLLFLFLAPLLLPGFLPACLPSFMPRGRSIRLSSTVAGCSFSFRVVESHKG